MNLFDAEIRRVQNPAYGAVLVHYLAGGYSSKHAEHAPIPLPYIFVAMPCLFSAEILDSIKHTNGGLRASVDKLNSSEKAGTDLILSINHRARQMRSLTLESICVLISTGLGALDVASATLMPLREKLFSARKEVPPEANEAHKLGAWLAPLSAFEIGSILKVRF